MPRAVTASELAARLALPIGDVHIALATLESRGPGLPGPLPRFQSGDEIEWCNRRILARIHHLTLGRLRREIAPVTAAQFHQFLARWQHVAPGTQLHGADGAMQIVRQLQGFEIPASAWEESVLQPAHRRIRPGESGRSLPLGRSGVGAGFRRIRRCWMPTGTCGPRASRRFRSSLREDADWLIDPAFGLVETVGLVACRRAKSSMRLQRAARRSSPTWCAKRRRLPSEVEDALWELTAGGLVTADGFENLRALIDPKRRRGEGRGSRERPRHAAGRWALVTRSAACITRG